MTTTPKEESDKALQPLFDEVNGKRGATTALAKALSEATGGSCTRQMVQNYLHPDVTKRKQPSLGMGLLMLRIGAGIVLAKPSPSQNNEQRNRKKQNK